MTDLTPAMAEIKEANEKHGVNVRGEKKYLEVAKRVEIFRKHYGSSYGITTTIEHFGQTQGEPVMVSARIETENGFCVATGHASEVIGAGPVNKASALENAETSAIGRALACLGLHGGEFASLNEMKGIGVKPDNPTTEALIDAWEDGIMDGLPPDPSPQTVADAYVDQMLSDITAYKQIRALEGYLKKHRKHTDFIEENSPERFAELRAKSQAKWDELKAT